MSEHVEKPTIFDLIRLALEWPVWLKVKNPRRAAELYAIAEDRDLTNSEAEELCDLVAGCAETSEEEVKAAVDKTWAKICEDP